MIDGVETSSFVLLLLIKTMILEQEADLILVVNMKSIPILVEDNLKSKQA